MTKRNLLTIWLPLIGFVVLLALSLSSRDALLFFFIRTSFFLLLVMSIVWAWQGLVFLRSFSMSWKQTLKRYGPGVLLALALTALVFSTVPVGFKILADEVNLLSVSQSIYLKKDVSRTTIGKREHGNFYPLAGDIPNRPLLFPFSAGVFHAVFGYRPANVFALNFLITFAFLAGVYIAVKSTLNAYTGAAAMLLIIGSPVFTIHCTSGGYDLFFNAFFALAMVLVYRMCKAPDADGFAFLWISLVLLSNIRYESCIVFVIVLALMVGIVKGRFFRTHPFVFAITPILSLPYIWQRLLSQGTYENPPGVALFSLGHFFQHTGVLIRNFFNFDMYLPYNGVLNAVGLAVTLYAGYYLVSHRRSVTGYALRFSIVLAACIGSLLVIVLSHHFGVYNKPTQTRLFMNVSLYFALTPILYMVLKPRAVSGKAMLAAALLVFVLYHPIATAHRFPDSLLATRMRNSVAAILKQYPPDEVVVITAYPRYYTVLNYAAMDYDYAAAHRMVLAESLLSGQYNNMIVVQEFRYPQMVLVDKSAQVVKQSMLKSINRIKLSENRVLLVSSGTFSALKNVRGRDDSNPSAD